MKRVLVTGAGGYIGSVLTKELLDHGYAVVAFDRFFFGQKVLQNLKSQPALTIVKKDIRDIESRGSRRDLRCLRPRRVVQRSDRRLGSGADVQYQSRGARACRPDGQARRCRTISDVESCSVYGRGEGVALHEDAPKLPPTCYARANLAAEEKTLALADSRFCATALHNATVFGLSPRMRFDLVVNLMTLHAVERARLRSWAAAANGGHWCASATSPPLSSRH